MSRYVSINNVPIDPYEAIIEGQRPGYEIVNKFGRNDDIDTGSVPEDVWHGGGVYTGFPTGSPETIEVLSANANDTADGSGARTVILQGLDSNGNELSEIVTLNGTTPVTTTNTWTRMNRAIVLTSGADNQNFNAGDITARGSDDNSNVYMVMPAGTNQTQIACYTVPAGKTLYFKNFYVEMSRSSGTSASGGIWVRENGASPRIIRQFSISQNSAFNKSFIGGLVFPELTDFAVRVTSVSSNNASVTASFDIINVDTNLL